MTCRVKIDVDFDGVEWWPELGSTSFIHISLNHTARELIQFANGDEQTIDEYPIDSTKQCHMFVEPHSDIREILQHHLGTEDDMSEMLALYVSFFLVNFGSRGIMTHITVKVAQETVTAHDYGYSMSLDLYNDHDDWVFSELNVDDDQDSRISDLDMDLGVDYDEAAEYIPGGIGASEDVILRLKEERAIQGKSLKKNLESTSCVVCMEKFSVSDVIIDMPCDHLFHEACIFEWLRRQNTCPLCRHVPYDSLSSCSSHPVLEFRFD